MLLVPLVCLAALFATQDPAAEAPATPEPEARGLASEERSLHPTWLRHEGLVLDVDAFGPDAIVTLEAGGRLTVWDREARRARLRLEMPGAVEFETVPGPGPEPAGVLIAIGGENPHVDFVPQLGGPPRWSLEGVRGPLAVDPAGRRACVAAGDEVELVDIDSGQSRQVFTLSQWQVGSVQLDDSTLALLVINRPKSFGRAGTEEEASAAFLLLDSGDGNIRVAESIDDIPLHVVRTGRGWGIQGRDGAISVLPFDGGLEPLCPPFPAGPMSSRMPTSITLTPAGLLAVLDNGVVAHAAAEGGDWSIRGRVGVGGARAALLQAGGQLAVSTGTAVRLLGVEDGARSGAQGFSAQISSLEFEGGADGRLLASSFDRTTRVVALDGSGDRVSHGAPGVVQAATLVGGERPGLAWVARGGRLERRVFGDEEGALGVGGLGPLAEAWTDVVWLGDRIVTALAGGGLATFDADTLEPVLRVSRLGGNTLLLAPTTGAVFVGGSGLTSIDPADGTVLARLGDLGAPVTSLDATADGLGVVGLASGGVATFRLDGEPRILDTIANHRGRVRCVALTEDGRWVASMGTNDSALSLSRLNAEGALEETLELPWSGPICTALDWSLPDAEGRRLLASGRLDGTISVREIRD